MISSLDGQAFEPVVESDLDFILSLQDWRLIPAIDNICPIVINVLKTSHDAVQVKFFTSALKHVARYVPQISERFKIHYVINKDIRDQDLIPKDIVDWLLSSHIHIIYSHLHQGTAISQTTH